MKINKQFSNILNKEMNRKDFLKYGGSMLLAVVGITGLLNTLTGIGGEDSAKSSSNGYGSSPYGM